MRDDEELPARIFWRREDRPAEQLHNSAEAISGATERSGAG